MPLAAYLPETRTRDTSHPVADAIARNPELRALRAPELARAVGVPQADAIDALEIVTRRTTGAIDRSTRSLDERFSRHGRSAPAASWADAGAIWRNPQRRAIYDAGTVVTSKMAKVPLPLGFVYSIGQRQNWPADPSNPNEPDPKTLDQLALLAFPSPVFTSPIMMWSALYPWQQEGLRALWRTQLRDARLPTDEEKDNPAIQWPNQGDTLERHIFWWDVEGPTIDVANTLISNAKMAVNDLAKTRVMQRMQLQKWDHQADNGAGAWKPYNQFGQNLVYTRQGTADKWTAGWDLGSWVGSNEQALADSILWAFRIVSTGLATVFGAGVGGAAVAGAWVAWDAMIGGMTSLTKGDIAGAAFFFSKAAESYGALLKDDPWSKQTAQAITKWLDQNAAQLKTLATDAQNVLNVFAKTLEATKGKLTSLNNIPILRDGARAIAKTLPTITPADVDKAVSEQGPLAGFFLRGMKDLTATGIPNDIPWYAAQTYTAGQIYKATIEAQRPGAGGLTFNPLRPAAPRIDPAKLLEAQKYEATAAELCNAAATMRKNNRPKEAALLQTQCDEARKKAAGLLVTPATGGGAAVVPLAAGAGLLWLLLKGAAL